MIETQSLFGYPQGRFTITSASSSIDICPLGDQVFNHFGIASGDALVQNLPPIFIPFCQHLGAVFLDFQLQLGKFSSTSSNVGVGW